MRWRFVDRITAFDAWKRIEGRKAVSLEEYSLLAPQGREGEFPESLLLECCVQFARWLIVASSDFHWTGELAGVGDFRFEQIVRAGQLLHVSSVTTAQSDDAVEMTCELISSSGLVCAGALTFRIAPLQDSQDPLSLKILWKEICGQAQR